VAVKTGQLLDETIGRIATARMINMVCGAPVVTPWDVYDLPDEWIDACSAYAKALSQR